MLHSVHAQTNIYERSGWINPKHRHCVNAVDCRDAAALAAWETFIIPPIIAIVSLEFQIIFSKKVHFNAILIFRAIAQGKRLHSTYLKIAVNHTQTQFDCVRFILIEIAITCSNSTTFSRQRLCTHWIAIKEAYGTRLLLESALNNPTELTQKSIFPLSLVPALFFPTGQPAHTPDYGTKSEKEYFLEMTNWLLLFESDAFPSRTDSL